MDILGNAATTMAEGFVTIRYSDENNMCIASTEAGAFVIQMPKRLASAETLDILIGGIIHEGGHARCRLS